MAKKEASYEIKYLASRADDVIKGDHRHNILFLFFFIAFIKISNEFSGDV